MGRLNFSFNIDLLISYQIENMNALEYFIIYHHNNLEIVNRITEIEMNPYL